MFFYFCCFVVLYSTQKFAGDLMIRNIQLNHAGKYVCIVDTDVESLSADAVLVVEGNQSSCFMCCMFYELISLKLALSLKQL